MTDRLYGGVLLAAGEGRRFGGPKALAELGGELLVERGVRLLGEGGCVEVVVVLGAGADEVRRRAELGAARAVVNPDWPTGMGSSLAAGLRALGPETGAAVVALVDQPLVGPAAVRRLARAWRDGAVAAVATYRGQPRNPVLLDRSLWPAVVRSATGDRGARDFLRTHADLVTPVACDDTGKPDDVDTVTDLLAIAKEREPCG
ncbi:MAG: nucleotidyltransferase family protein [Egibacteraceae bacterium]